MVKRISLLMVLVIFLTCLLPGCSSKGKSVSLYTETEANFIIVRPSDCEKEQLKIMNKVKKKIERMLEIKVDYRPDSIKSSEEQLELNLGVTNRPEAKKIYDEIIAAHGNNSMDFTIRMVNNVIYVVGVSDKALENAISVFLQKYCVSVDSTINTNCNIQYHFEGVENPFTINGKLDISDYKIVTPKYNMSYIIGREIPILQEAIMSSNASNVKEVDDSTKSTKKEIVIGNSKRDGVKAIKDADSYKISVSGEKIFINGGSDISTAIAVKEFTSWVTEGKNVNNKSSAKGNITDLKDKYKENYSLTFSDEFDKLDTTIWSPEKGKFTNQATAGDCFMVDDAKSLFIRDGNLVLKPSTDGKVYNSVELRTDESIWYKYGLLEISAKMNVSKGLCAAFWTLGMNGRAYYGETDIFECFGKKSQIKATPISHVAKSVEGASSDVYYCGAIDKPYEKSYFNLKDGDTWDDEYHTFAVEWTDTFIKWAYDGREFLTIDTTADERAKKSYNDFQQIILTYYSGCDVGNATGFPDESTDWKNAEFVINELNLYQLPNQRIKDRR